MTPATTVPRPVRPARFVRDWTSRTSIGGRDGSPRRNRAFVNDDPVYLQSSGAIGMVRRVSGQGCVKVGRWCNNSGAAAT